MISKTKRGSMQLEDTQWPKEKNKMREGGREDVQGILCSTISNIFVSSQRLGTRQ